MTFYEIPLQPTNQNIRISILNVTYIIRTYYCDRENGGWVIDISKSDGTALVQGIPLVTGADMLGQYEYLGLGFGLIFASDGDINAVSGFNDLGVSGHLYVVV